MQDHDVACTWELALILAELEADAGAGTTVRADEEDEEGWRSVKVCEIRDNKSRLPLSLDVDVEDEVVEEDAGDDDDVSDEEDIRVTTEVTFAGWRTEDEDDADGSPRKVEFTAVKFNNRWYYYGDMTWIDKIVE